MCKSITIHIQDLVTFFALRFLLTPSRGMGRGGGGARAGWCLVGGRVRGAGCPSSRGGSERGPRGAVVPESARAHNSFSVMLWEAQQLSHCSHSNMAVQIWHSKVRFTSVFKYVFNIVLDIEFY